MNAKTKIEIVVTIVGPRVGAQAFATTVRSLVSWATSMVMPKSVDCWIGTKNAEPKR